MSSTEQQQHPSRLESSSTTGATGEEWQEKLSPTGQNLYEKVSRVIGDIQTTKEALKEDQGLQETMASLSQLTTAAKESTSEEVKVKIQKEFEAFGRSCIELARAVVSSQEWRQIVKDSLSIFGEALMIQLDKKWVSSITETGSGLTSDITGQGVNTTTGNSYSKEESEDTQGTSRELGGGASRFTGPAEEEEEGGRVVKEEEDITHHETQTGDTTHTSAHSASIIPSKSTVGKEETSDQPSVTTTKAPEEHNVGSSASESEIKEPTSTVTSAASALRGLFRSSLLGGEEEKEEPTGSSTKKKEHEKQEEIQRPREEQEKQQKPQQEPQKQIPHILVLDEESRKKLNQLSDKFKHVFKLFVKQKEREDMETHINTIWRTLAHWKEMRQDLSEDAKKTLDNAKFFLESKANNKSMDPLIHATMQWLDKMQSHEIWSDLVNLYDRSKKNPDYMHTKEFDDKVSQWTEKFYDAMHEQSDLGQIVVEESVAFISALPTPTVVQDIKELRQDSMDLFYRVLNSASARKEIAHDISHDAQVVWDRISQYLSNVHVPRIEENTAEHHIILDNIYLQCEAILPESITIKTETRMNTPFSSVVRVDIHSIKAKVEEMTWMFFQKKGLMSSGDVGVADVDLGKEGMSISLTFGRKPTSSITGSSLRQPQREHGMAMTEGYAPSSMSRGEGNMSGEETVGAWVLSSCKVKLHDLKLRFHETGHDWMLHLFNPLIKARVDDLMEDAIQTRINKYLFQAREQTKKFKESTGKIAEKIMSSATTSTGSTSATTGSSDIVGHYFM